VSIDLVIRKGTILDGTASEMYQADLAIENGRIVHIGRVEANDVASIDAEGMYVAPGFIDIHSHSDWTLMVDPRAVSAIHQGVTLEVLGNCGYGCAGPIKDPEISKRIILGFSDDIPFDWSGAGSYFDRLETIGPAVNVLSLVPNGQLRLAAMGVSPDPASPEEASEMKVLLEESLEEGAWGYSTGLEFVSESGASELEVTDLCKTVKKYGGLYATHTRKRGDSGAVEAVEEAVRTAKASGVRLQISHLLPRQQDDFERCVEVVDAAQENGLDVHFDMHTRPFGLAFLHMALPSWLNREPKSLRKQLADPKVRDKMKRSPTIFNAKTDWNRVVLLDNSVWPEYSRRYVGEIASERGQDPLDVVYDLLLKNPEGMYEPLGILESMYSARVHQEIFSHPLCMPGSDATVLATDGVLGNSTFHGAYTWAAWFYRFMVLEKSALTPEEAVHKLTGLPASVLGLKDRGVLRPGAWADIAIFDPQTFGERGTPFEPNQLAEGMRDVLVNGKLTLNQGKLTGERTGKIIRRERIN
jgi:N-acyl-D-amino-acid deacylase